MATNSAGHALSRVTTYLLGALMVVSTVLFVVGVALERSSSGSGETHAPAAQLAPAATAAAPEGSAAREAQEQQPAAATTAPEGAEGTAAHEAAEQNQVFGIDVESPWVIGSVVLLTVLLIIALFLFGERILPLVVLVALVVTVFDMREIGYQLGQGRYLIAALAIGVVISRIVTAAVAWRAWRMDARQIHSTGAL
jgi:hypothetical protein